MDPIYIHQRPDWPEFRWDAAALANPLAEIRCIQGRLLGRMESPLFPLPRQEAHLEVLTIETVKSSAIEGEKLDAGQVRSSLARHLGIEVGGTAPVSRSVEGVVEMMLDATGNFKDPLTPERLFGWQAALFPAGRSGLRKLAVGAWRTGSMQVVSGPAGNETIQFQAPHAARVPEEMDRFLTWFNAPSREDPVIRAALAHLWFVTIHPFEDGNGRIARAIADMALARADGHSERFYSMSAQIEAERDDYYAALESSQKGDLEITAWMAWFLGCLGRSLARAETILAGVLRKARTWQRIGAAPLNERQRHLVNRLLDGREEQLTSSRAGQWTNCSADTALRDINKLVELGILARNESGGRSTGYRLAAPPAGAEAFPPSSA